jgi:hypothetical protein
LVRNGSWIVPMKYLSYSYGSVTCCKMLQYGTNDFNNLFLLVVCSHFRQYNCKFLLVFGHVQSFKNVTPNYNTVLRGNSDSLTKFCFVNSLQDINSAYEWGLPVVNTGNWNYFTNEPPVVTNSQVLFHDGSLLHSKFNIQPLITISNSSRILTHVQLLLVL